MAIAPGIPLAKRRSPWPLWPPYPWVAAGVSFLGGRGLGGVVCWGVWRRWVGLCESGFLFVIVSCLWDVLTLASTLLVADKVESIVC